MEQHGSAAGTKTALIGLSLVLQLRCERLVGARVDEGKHTKIALMELRQGWIHVSSL